jgi:hypothetical protein
MKWTDFNGDKNTKEMGYLHLYHNPFGRLNIYIPFKNGARYKTFLHRLPVQLIFNA